MADENENLPATQEAALPALELNHLPARQLAAETVTDVLPAVVYQNIGSLANTLSPEQEELLDEPTPDDEIEIRPDGLVYASHELYRRKLNKVFGRFGWTLIPGSPLKNRLDKSNSERSEWFQRWVLFINGIYVSEAIASRTLYEDNKQMSLDDVAEAIKSDALKRCAKDLGIAHELWQKRWTERWRREHAIQVPCRIWKRGSQVVENRWRRKDQDPLEGELTAAPKDKGNTAVNTPASGIGSIRTNRDAQSADASTSSSDQQSTVRTGSQSTARVQHTAALGKTSNSTTSTQPPNDTLTPTASGIGARTDASQSSPSASHSAVNATAQRLAPSGNDQSGMEQSRDMGEDASAQNAERLSQQRRASAGADQSASRRQQDERTSAQSADAAVQTVARPTQPTSARSAPVISNQQMNLILALGRKHGLILEDDPQGLCVLLGRQGIEWVEHPGKTHMENCIATLRTVQMRQFQALLNEVKKAGATDEQAERI